jgi:hypothetical protein
MYDFKHVTDFIFKKKDEYKKLSDEDKERTFFVINRKLARGMPFFAEFLNKKSMNRATSMDIWYYYFVKKRFVDLPKWFYFKLSGKTKKKSSIKPDEREFLLSAHGIEERDLNFLLKYYPDDVKEELKKFRKFNKKK